jgi:hypothetical protein
MNRFLALIASLAAALSFMAAGSAAQTKMYKGEITDEHLNCVQTPVKATEGITDKASCALYWAHFVQPYSKFVLYDAATKTIYQLDDQNLVLPYVAARVEVTGTLNTATKTIKVTGIKVDENAYKTGAHS